MALSTDGISHQIVSSLMTYRKDKFGTVNDCKVVLNHLIRKFSEPLAKEGLQQFYRSKNITEAEDQALNAHGYQRNMPQEYFDANHSLHNDAWARYKSAGIYSNIARSKFPDVP
ncbi:hypothetical protein [Paraglaciecola sp. T6c]|uniref:hypothetical protein n=1 Tax=Pseudoalteromonas atlantica (strain T6c / ATCC BAA-1087) TaxID=3042615 RepID=UPI00059FA79C|nr:hypothetical protein [Paraglaciecola sp. T6c]